MDQLILEFIKNLGQEQRKNLKLLADYLYALPEDYEHFTMELFNVDTDSPYEVKSTSCGTVACAVGHMPYVEGMPSPEPFEGWVVYSSRVLLGGNYDCSEEILWEFLFSGGWVSYDNTTKGAAKRIYYVLSLTENAADINNIADILDIYHILGDVDGEDTPELSKVYEQADSWLEEQSKV